MALLLSCESLTKSFGARPLFTGLSFSLAEGQRTGLIGANGSGKSTLLKIIAGIEHSDGGEMITKRQLRLAYMPQVDRFADGATVLSAVTAELPESMDEHDRDTRASIILSKVGFRDFDAPADSLSGGWKKRLVLAREIAKEPELLLLDEPTNHLDLEGIRWLEDFLSSAPFATLLVSHDRYLLENASNRIIEIGHQYKDGSFSVDGSYSEFLEKREEYLDSQSAQETAMASRVRREIEWLKRGAQARTTKAKGRIQQAAEMKSELGDLKSRNTTTRVSQFDFTSTNRQTRKLITAEKISKSLGGKTLFSNLSFILGPGTKLGLLGLNGSGKTTLIKMITGALTPDTGEIKRADNLRIVLFDQARARLDPNQTLRQALSPTGDNVLHQSANQHVVGWAKRFLFRAEQLDMAVRDLSGGEQSRVLIARLMREPADVLILDEPTNDLDIPSLEVLEESLEQFEGALVLVTHDRFMLDRLASEFIGLDGRGGAAVHADLSQWERARKLADEAEASAKSVAKAAAAQPATKKKGLSYMELRELEQIEAKLLRVETELEKSHAEMNDPAVLADHVKLRDACERARLAQERVDQTYHRWQELEAKRG